MRLCGTSRVFTLDGEVPKDRLYYTVRRVGQYSMVAVAVCVWGVECACVCVCVCVCVLVCVCVITLMQKRSKSEAGVPISDVKPSGGGHSNVGGLAEIAWL